MGLVVNNLKNNVNILINKDIELKNLNLKDNLNINLEIEKNSQVNIVDNILELNIFSNNLNIILNENSKINYILKTDCLHGCAYFCKSCLKNKENIIINKKLNIKLMGQNSRASIKIAFNGAGKNVLNLETIQEHLAASTKSNLNVKICLSQFAGLISNNIIKVAKNLKQIESFQSTKALMFGCSSSAICTPVLEIESQDVICKHGAAISKINPEQIFYLESRGLDYCKAKDLLINAFLE
ncbi:MAG: FeS assembly protein SufD [candidate division TM6 bacterium GW2011_GWF2_28_16]|nr:MAG: FeS assembly protein SufD [candidate division TM6 bacterium GW2011_GWF2_28_16]